MTSKIFSNIGPNDLIAYRIEKGFNKALVCHNTPLDTDLTGVVSWVKLPAQAKSLATQTTAAYTGNNCYPISGLVSGSTYDISMAFTDEFASNDAALLRAQYDDVNTILTNIYASSFTTAVPATISGATKVTNITKDLGSLVVKLDIAGHANVDRLTVRAKDGVGSWVTVYSGISAPSLDISLGVGDYQLDLTSIIEFSDGSIDTSTAMLYSGANVVIDAELDKLTSARTLIVSANSQTFSFDADGLSIGNSSVTLTARLQNVETGTTVWSTVPANIGTDNLDGTYTITAAEFGENTTVQVTATHDDLSDTTTIARLQDGLVGSSPVVVLLSNSNHTLPADTEGTVLDLNNSGTQIHVYEGVTALTYDGVGTEAGTWKLSPAPTTSNVTIGAITDGGVYAQVANLVGMGEATPTGSITYNVTGTLANGEAFTASPATQSFSKALAGVPAQGVVASATGQAFTYNADGHFGSTSIVITANLKNLTGTPAWSFAASGTFGGGTDNLDGTYTVTEAQFADNDYVTITATVDAFSDSITIVRLTDGAAGISPVTAILSNAVHSVPSAADGTVTDLTGSGTTLTVYEGTTALTYATTPTAGQWKAVLTPTGVTTPGIGAGGVVGDLTAMGSDVGSISFNITGFRADGVAFDAIVVSQSLSKSKQGSGDRGATNLSAVVSTATLSAGWGAAADAAADAVTPGDNIIGDRVTLLDNASLIETRTWDGVNWITIDQVLDGNVLFPGSVTASKINVEDLFATDIEATGTISAINNGNTVSLSGKGANLISATSGGVNLFYVSATGGGRASGTWLTPGTVPFAALSQDAVDKLSNQAGATAESTGGTKSVDFNFSGNTGATPITMPSALKHGSNIVTITFAGSGSSDIGGAADEPFFDLTIKRNGVAVYGPTRVYGASFVEFGQDSRFISVDVSDTDNPTAGEYTYTAEITNANNLGGMNVSGTFKVTEDVAGGGAGGGTISPATTSELGGVIVGNGLSVETNGTLSTAMASSTQLGAIKVGTGLSIDGDGIVTADAQSYSSFSGTTAGLVPDGTGHDSTKYLNGSGSWSTPPDTNTTYSSFSGTTAGLVPDGTGHGSTKYLNGSGSWSTPPDTNTTYSSFSGTTAGLVPDGTGHGSTKYLNGSGSWSTPPDTNTTYSAGTGMSLVGNEFRCTVTDTNTTYSAGTALTLTGTTFSVSLGTGSTQAAKGNHTHSQYADKGATSTQSFSGAITATSVSAGSITYTSDINVKYNIQEIEDALGKVEFIGGQMFNRSDMDGELQAGVIAQKVQEVLPEAVYTDEGGQLSVSAPQTIGLLFAAVKELSERLKMCERDLKRRRVE